jgi:predicted RNA-binding protein with PIN domain
MTMHYLIDGHNLIGKMTDIDLDDPDDEVKLVLRLRSWSARSRKRKVTVIFDRGLPGGEEKGLSSGKVKVIFAPAGHSADSLLISRIHNVKNPTDYTLVSSDQRIIHLAEARRMFVWRSETFDARMNQEREQSMGSSTAETIDDPKMSVDEVEMWLEIFTTGQGDSEG